MKNNPSIIRKKSIQRDFRSFLAFNGSGRKISRFLGNDLAGVREWIEQNFMPGMSWLNYGEVWVVDHIVPVRMFDILSDSDMAICWNYKNLMPLFKSDNLKKEGNVFFSYELLLELKNRDPYYLSLIEIIKPEVDTMISYIEIYHKRYFKS